MCAGDDCISVISGARNITAKNGFCGFSSHGLSIGSLGHYGANDTVANVLFHNWTMSGAVYGARVSHFELVPLLCLTRVSSLSKDIMAIVYSGNSD